MCCSFFAFPIMQTYFVQYILMVACDIQANIFSISFYKNHIYKCCIQNSFIDRISMINKNIKIIKNFFALLSFFYLETEIQVIDTDKSYYVIPVCARFFSIVTFHGCLLRIICFLQNIVLHSRMRSLLTTYSQSRRGFQLLLSLFCRSTFRERS